MCWTDRLALGLLLAHAGCAASDALDPCADGGRSAGRLPVTPDPARYEVLWRAGGGDDHLATPLPVALSRSGRAAVVDFELGELFVVEPDGTWRGAVARRGSGPGELSAPVAAVWADDGSLHVHDLAKPAIVRFADDLSYIGEARVESRASAAIFAAGRLDWAGVQPSGATVFLPGLSQTSAGMATEVVLRVDPARGEADTLRTGSVPLVRTADGLEAAAPGHSRISAAVGAGGRVGLIGGADGRVLDIYDDAGTRILRLCSAPPPEALTDAERGHVADGRFRDLAAAFADAAVPAEPALHGRIVLGADGTIWVQRERGSPYPDESGLLGDAGTTFDVFSPGGEHLRTLQLPESARLQGALGDTIWAYEVSDLDEVTLVAYRVVAG
ncbi:MAG TPA: hypothetical protein VFZ69_08405 [Longimicrobiales bacterium]